MRSKSSILFAMILSMLMLSLSSIQVLSQAPEFGPRTDFLHIMNYGIPWKEFAALEVGEIDIVDWHLDKTWIDKFAVNPEIVLTSFSDISSYEYDIYCQRWPTGVGEPAEYDPETDTYKHWFDPTNEWDVRAWGFRLALAYLTDKDYIRTEILKGYGFMMDTWLAGPQMGWGDIENLTDSSFIYPGGDLTIGTADDVNIPSLIYTHDVTKAQELLDSAGFDDPDDNGIRNDPKGDWSVGGAGTDLKPLIFYIRLDDLDRKAAGEKFAADLEEIGIPVDIRITEKTVCFKAVMQEYDYHLYTGGYSYGADPWEILWGDFHSAQYWAPIGFAGGYQGFCNRDFDHYAGDMVKNGRTYEEVLYGVRNATYIANKYVCSIPIWSTVGVHAYREGWEGVVNHEGYGIPWGTGGVFQWSLFNMYKLGVDTINYGLKSNPDSLHIVGSEWVYEFEILDAIYDCLFYRNPYNLAEAHGGLATSWTTGIWDTDKIYVNFTLRDGVKWHDGTLFTPEDAKWAIEFVRDCGPGVAWQGMQNLPDVDHVDAWSNGIVVYFETGSYWAVNLAGTIRCFPSRKIWMAASEAIGFGYDAETHTFEDRLAVKDYHPWEMDVYDASTGGVGSDGIVDLAQDGTGPWIFVGADPLLMEYVDLRANREYFLSQEDVSGYLAEEFRRVGDANMDRVVDIADMQVMARALGTDDSWIHGTDWNQYNPDADLNGDGKVDASDVGTAGRSYGKSAG